MGAILLLTILFPPRTQPISHARLVHLALTGDEQRTSAPNFSILDYIRSFETGLTPEEEWELASLIYFESQKYGYDPEFILALIQIESAFNPTAVSVVGARGLMQIMPATGRELAGEFGIPWEGTDTLENPSINIRMGMYYLFKMLLKYEDLRLALVAYNCGPGAVDGMLHRGAMLPADYVEKVMGAYERIVVQGM
jgi:soluble lytic murein transglycosylase